MPYFIVCIFMLRNLYHNDPIKGSEEKERKGLSSTMKTLVIVAHPDLNASRVNRRWKEELLKHPGEIELHELYAEYPDWQIDVTREQQLLEAHERVILQFPFYWYSYPPLLKKWFDEVFAYG